MDLSAMFWNATVEEIKQGYVYSEEADGFVCLVCGETFTKGVIYRDGETFYEAQKFAAVHVEQAHSSMFEYLLGLNKKLTGLTDLQKSLLQFFYNGYSDNEIVKEMDGGSTSTIRNHRFSLREREKQAKVFLAIMGLIENRTQKKQKFIPIHRTASVVDERFAITEEENEDILKAYFKEGLDGPLHDFPKKEKKKIAILHHIIKRFDLNKRYTEKEVNEILSNVYNDYVTLRRYLIEYGFMDRKSDGSQYWVKIEAPSEEGENQMINRSEAKRTYKEEKSNLGVYKIVNKQNGKILISASRNVNANINRDQFMLKTGMHPNKRLQEDWNKIGAENFSFEMVETLKRRDDVPDTYLYNEELGALEQKWLDQLQPYGDKGYNG